SHQCVRQKRSEQQHEIGSKRSAERIGSATAKVDVSAHDESGSLPNTGSLGNCNESDGQNHLVCAARTSGGDPKLQGHSSASALWITRSFVRIRTLKGEKYVEQR